MDAIQLLLSKNKEEREIQTGYLVQGLAKDYADYRHICGVVRGLYIADQHITDLAKRMEKETDE